MKRLMFVFGILFLAIISATVIDFSPHSAENVLIDKIIIYKSKRLLEGYSKGKVIVTYKIALGFEPLGPKQQQGDGRTPEGEYHISFKNKDSQYHKSLKVSYPNDKDIQQAKKRGVNPGGDIYIHGIKNGLGFIGRAHALKDWTLGCIAVTDEEIDDLWRQVETGTTVIIYP